MTEVIVSIVATLIIALVGVVWSMLNEKIRANKEACAKDSDALWAQIGRDSYSGMRKMLHATEGHTTMLTELDRRLDKVERR